METKLPVTGNRMIAGGRRGIALISVVSVLVLLAIVATPFLVTMRDSAIRGERFLYSARADWEAESLFELVRANLTRGLPHVERRALDEFGPVASDARPPDSATPGSDTRSEFEIPDALLERFNRVTAREQRVWDVQVRDQQALFNVNNCSYPVLANILGRSEVAAELSADDNRIVVADASLFPPEGGVVRVGSECVRYEAVSGSELIGCERGYRSDLPENPGPSDWQVGDVVVLEAAFQIATRPFRARPGSWVDFTNPYQVRTISELGVASLTPDQFDALRPYITTSNGNVVGDGWSNPQLVRNGITAAAGALAYAEIANVRYFGVGTVVRITDGVNSDYGVVTKVRGSNQVLLAGRIDHDYTADQTRIYSLARSPVNINTCDRATLVKIFEGLHLRGRNGAGLTLDVAQRLADFLRTWTVDGETEPGVYRTWGDFTRALDSARADQNILDDDAYKAVLLNAMNANDSLLGFSTVPFTFASYDTYEIRAAASLLDATGRELARREFRRVVVASSITSSRYVVETQAEFQDQIMKSRDGKWFATYPDNVNAHYDGANIPASEYFAFAQKSRFPSTDRAAGVGHVALLPGAFRFANRRIPDRVHHFDESDLPDGLDLAQENFDVSVDGPYSVDDRKADLVEFVDADPVGQDVEVGLRDFALSFWYQPQWTRGQGDQVIFDYGLDDDLMNRVSLGYDSRRDLLVLAVADATREQRAAEVYYEFDHTTWDTETWYHIGVHVGGTHPSQLELFIDGEKQGLASGITRLTSSVASTGDVQELRVEDARSFPDSGALVLRAVEGLEIMEYASHTDNAFRITRRKARTIDHENEANEPRTHAEGDIVELYGFSGPLLSDLKRGGATLDANIGPFRVYRFNYTLDTLEDQNNPANFMQGLGASASSTTLPITGVTLTEWDTGDNSPTILDDLGGQGAQGLALLVSNSANITPTASSGGGGPGGGGNSAGRWQVRAGSVNAASEQQSNDIGGTEIIRYSVQSGGQINIEQRNVQLEHVTYDINGNDGFPRFIPTYSFGDTSSATATFGLAVKTSSGFQTVPNGAYTAFIPIGIVATGATREDYLLPAENEPQVGQFAYVQVGSEWVKYDWIDSQAVSGRLVFYRSLRIDDVQNVFSQINRPLTEDQVNAQIAAAVGNKGGSGGNSSSGFTPPHATDDNVESQAPPEPTQGVDTSGFLPPTQDQAGAMDIARAFDCRGMELRSQSEEFRIANTIPRDHQQGTQVLPTFRVVPGNAVELDNDKSQRGAFPGFDDLITLRDARLNDEHVRVQWGYRGWVGLTQTSTQAWTWDRPDIQRPVLAEYDLRRFDSRLWTRALKFPSGELPDAGLTTAAEKLKFGRRYDDNGGTSPALLDEVFFPDFQRGDATRPNYVMLGEVPANLDPQFTQAGSAAQQAVEPRFAGIDEKEDKIKVHMAWFDDTLQATVYSGLPIDDRLFPTDGGVLRVDDELILYSSFDPEQGLFEGCVRGTFLTEAKPHGYNAVVSPIHTFPASRLVNDVDESSGSYQLVDATDFPDDGYLRIGDRAEIIGYTLRNDNELSGPLGRVDPSKASQRQDAEARVGGAIFRGRFGSIPEAYAVDDVVVAMPFRHYDRYSERSDDPELSYVQLSWTKPGAVWKRVTWDEVPRSFIDVIALVRFEGGPAWDSDQVVRVGQDMIPETERRKWLYEITDPTAENLLNIESDRLELRFLVRFNQGAYDRFADVAPDFWKQTPWIQQAVVEFVAPPSVIYEDK